MNRFELKDPTEHELEYQEKIRSLVKRLVFSVMIITLSYFVTEPLLGSIYKWIANSNDLITISSPTASATKYFVVIIVVFVLLYRSKHIKLTKGGKKIIPTVIAICSIGVLFTTTYVNATSEAGVIQQRLLMQEKKTWNDVDYIQTRATTVREVEVFGRTVEVRSYDMPGGLGRLVPTFEYRIHFKDGTSVNVWDETNRLYNLHAFVKSKDIKVNHEEVRIGGVNFYLKGDKQKIKEILGMED